MEYRFGKLKTNPVRIVKYRFDSININSLLFRTSIYTIFGLISRAKKNVTLVPKLVCKIRSGKQGFCQMPVISSRILLRTRCIYLCGPIQIVVLHILWLDRTHPSWLRSVRMLVIRLPLHHGKIRRYLGRRASLTPSSLMEQPYLYLFVPASVCLCA